MVTTIGSRAVWISAVCECFSTFVEITVVRRDAQGSVTTSGVMATTRSSVKLVMHENQGHRAMLMGCRRHQNLSLFFSDTVTSNLSSPQSNIRWFDWWSGKRGDKKPNKLPLWDAVRRQAYSDSRNRISEMRFEANESECKRTNWLR